MSSSVKTSIKPIGRWRAGKSGYIFDMAPLVGSLAGSVALGPRLTALHADSTPQMTTETAADANADKPRKRIDKTAVHRELRLLRRQRAIENEYFDTRMAALETLASMEPHDAAAAELATVTHEARAEELEHDGASNAEQSVASANNQTRRAARGGYPQ